MAELVIVLAAQARRNLQRERLFLPRSDHLDKFDDLRLIRKYRLPRDSILQIIEMCNPHLDRMTNRNHSIEPHIQVMLALRFFAKGAYQEECSELVGLSQPSASRIINTVSSILAEKAHHFIMFPDTFEEVNIIKSSFFQLAGFPNVIGIIDGTHVKIRRPGGLVEPLYVCRKGGHSINVQVICDDKMRFMDVVARWPGSTNDSFIWRNSAKRQQFIENPPDGIMLGDSGYGCEPWLFNPLAEPRTGGEENYNKALVKTRRIVENAIGLWKYVFRCFDLSGGILLYKPEKCCRFIVAGTVLHNLRRSLRLPEDEAFIHPPIDNDEIPVNLNDDAISVEGIRQRNHFILNYF